MTPSVALVASPRRSPAPSFILRWLDLALDDPLTVESAAEWVEDRTTREADLLDFAIYGVGFIHGGDDMRGRLGNRATRRARARRRGA